MEKLAKPAPVTRIDSLTPEQRARFPEWVAKWTAAGLSTLPADRARAESAIAVYYRAAGLEPPKRAVWVPSPIVGALAFPAAALILAGTPEESPMDAVDSAVHSAVDSAVRSAVGSAVGSAVDSAVDSAVGSAVGSAVDSAVHSAVRSAVDSAVGSAVHSAVDSAVRSAVRSAVDSAVDSAVHSAVADPKVLSAYRSAFGSMYGAYLGGQFWVGYGWGYWGSPSLSSFFRDVCGLTLGSKDELVDAIVALGESCCWWWPHKDFVMVCERPIAIERDGAGRLHCDTGPAAGWGDGAVVAGWDVRGEAGWGVHAIHGVRVPQYVVERPETITIAQIEAEQNAEVRRVMIDRYGLARYVRDAKFDVLDTDVDPLGQRRRLLRKDGLTVVELTNSTEDYGGTRRVYHVPVHPELRPLLPNGGLGEPQALTALNAVASSYGLRGEQYRPGAET